MQPLLHRNKFIPQKRATTRARSLGRNRLNRTNNTAMEGKNLPFINTRPMCFSPPKDLFSDLRIVNDESAK